MTIRHIGQPVRNFGQSRKARWMRWQKSWATVREQQTAFDNAGISRSHSTIALWRNGDVPEGDTVFDVVAAFPELKKILWPEQQAARAEDILSKLDALDAQISELRSIL